MKYSKLLLVSVIYFMFIQNIYALQKNKLGLLPQTSQLTDKGSFNYSYPLDIPELEKNKLPGLSINYNSDNSVSTIGYGFNFSNMYTISRCPKTIAHNGVEEKVKFSKSDNFCLNGKILILDSSTSNQQVYFPEKDTKTKVVATITNNDVSKFKIFFKNGNNAELGYTNNSKVMSGDKVSAWGINKFTNIYSSSLTYTYNNGTELFNISEMNYEDDVKLVFNYDSTKQKKLNNINIKISNVTTKTYTFNYSDAFFFDINHEKLDNIVESSTNGEDYTTTFKWDKTTYSEYTNKIKDLSNKYISTAYNDNLFNKIKELQVDDYFRFYVSFKDNKSYILTGDKTKSIFSNDYFILSYIDDNNIVDGGFLNYNHTLGEISIDTTLDTYWNKCSIRSMVNIDNNLNNDEVLVQCHDIENGTLDINAYIFNKNDNKFYKSNSFHIEDISFKNSIINKASNFYEQLFMQTTNETITEETSGINSIGVNVTDYNNDGKYDIITTYYLDNGDKYFKVFLATANKFVLSYSNSYTNYRRWFNYTANGYEKYNDLISWNKETHWNDYVLKEIETDFNKVNITYDKSVERQIKQKINFENVYVSSYQAKKLTKINKITGNKNIVSNKYFNPKNNYNGVDFLGYEKVITETNTSTNEQFISTIEEKDFNTTYPLDGLITNKKSTIKEFSTYENYNSLNIDTNTIAESTIDYKWNKKEVGNNHFIYLDEKTTTNNINGVTTTEDYTYDSNNNLDIFTTTYLDGHINTIDYDYNHDEENWIIGQKNKETITKSFGKNSKTITNEYKYENTNNPYLLTKKIFASGNDKEFNIVYDYYSNFDLKTETTSGYGIKESRIVEYKYEADKDTVTDELNNDTVYNYNSKRELSSIAYPNGLTDSYTYDDFGRILTYSDGFETITYGYNLCSNEGINCPDSASYSISETFTKNASNNRTTYYNSNDKVVRTKTVGFKGNTIYQDTTYDIFGNVYTKSDPYYEGETLTVTNNIFDRYNRLSLKQRVSSDKTVTLETNSYDLNVKTTTFPIDGSKDSTKVFTYNDLGQIKNLVDENSNSVDYTYDLLSGKLQQIKKDGTIKVIYGYDIFGNLSSEYDNSINNDKEYKNYTFNGLGELLDTTNMGIKTTYVYDKVGRVTNEYSQNKNTTFVYDTKKIGKLSYSIDNDTGYKEEYFYDDLARVTDKKVTGNKNLSKNIVYNTKGQIEALNFNDGFSIMYEYNNGHLSAIKSLEEDMQDFDTAHIQELFELATLSEENALEAQMRYDELQMIISGYEKNLEYYNEVLRLYESIDDALADYVVRLKDRANDLDQLIGYLKFASYYYADKKVDYDNKSEDYRTKAFQKVYYAARVKRRRSFGRNRYRYYLYSRYKYNETTRNQYLKLSEKSSQYSDGYDYLSTTMKDFKNKIEETRLTGENEVGAIENIEFAEYYKKSIESLTTLINEQNEQVQYYVNLSNEYQKRFDEENELDYNSSASYYANLFSEDNGERYYYQILEQTNKNKPKLSAFGNGLITTSTYDKIFNRLESVKTGYFGSGELQDAIYTYNETGSLASLDNLNTNENTTFKYDSYNRLDYTTGAKETDIDYLDNGNIDSINTVTYNYNGLNPYVVSSTSNVNSILYDGNGNAYKNGNLDITYTTFNKPKTLSNGTRTLEFFYNPNNQRYKKTNSRFSETTYYFDKEYEKIENDYDIIDKYFIYYQGRPIALNIMKLNLKDETVTPYTRYFHYDNMGNVEMITDARGAIVEQYEYTPFGERTIIKKGENQDESRFTNRGFTGHEHIEDFDLIHMNGRLYDPTIAKFLSPDPFIQNPYNTQNFNRYSYVMNNPYLYTDPSGYFYWDLGVFTLTNEAGENQDEWDFSWNSDTVELANNIEAVAIGIGGLAQDTNFVSRSITTIGGTLQVGTGGALCTTGMGSIIGAPMVAHGINNIQEGYTGSDGYLKKNVYYGVFGGEAKNVYAAVDLSLAGAALTQKVGLKTTEHFVNGVGKVDYSRIKYGYENTARAALYFESMNTYNTVSPLID